MTDTVVAVQDLKKCYRIYESPTKRLRQFFSVSDKKNYTEFWALKGVSLQLNKGESLGVVGRNGSGKSTLLQILAGILPQTSGEVMVNGRISALLELGAGFNPEFSGADNVFLSGAILGLSRQEMEQKYDEICSFADIGSFLHQPVKTYSSGMFARLAFSVAISVDPDLLIVDEILSVGDMAFQQKCINKMRVLRDRGLTLIYVSHSADSIKSVCQKGLFLSDGCPMYWGGAEQAVDEYFNYIRRLLNEEAAKDQADIRNPIARLSEVKGSMRYGTGHLQVVDSWLDDGEGNKVAAVTIGQALNVNIVFESFIDTSDVSVSFLIRDSAGIDLTGTTSFDEEFVFPSLESGKKYRVQIALNPWLRSGVYGISVALNRVSRRDKSDNVLFDQVDGCIAFTVLEDPHKPIHYKFYSPVEIQFSAVE